MFSERSFVETSSKILKDSFGVPLIIEAWHSDPEVRQKWHDYGFACLFPMKLDGLFQVQSGTLPRSRILSSQSPYAPLFENLREAYEDGEISMGELNEVLDSFERGTFEPQKWSEYEPRQEE
jgi:hypothetical protein